MQIKYKCLLIVLKNVQWRKALSFFTVAARFPKRPRLRVSNPHKVSGFKATAV